jgi:hypothetical protein
MSALYGRQTTCTLSFLTFRAATRTTRDLASAMSDRTLHETGTRGLDPRAHRLLSADLRRAPLVADGAPRSGVSTARERAKSMPEDER